MVELATGVSGSSQVRQAQLQATGLQEGDARLDWVGKTPSQIGPPGSAANALARAVHGALRDSAQIHGTGDSRLRLVDFPLDVFSALRNDPEALAAVLESRNETINSVLKTWAESIKHNAEQDQKAHERRLENNEEHGREGHHKRLFVGALDKLVSAGVITRADAADLAEQAGIDRDQTFFGPGMAAEQSAKAMKPEPSQPMSGAFKTP